jgi:hypothetical protein
MVSVRTPRATLYSAIIREISLKGKKDEVREEGAGEVCVEKRPQHRHVVALDARRRASFLFVVLGAIDVTDGPLRHGPFALGRYHRRGEAFCADFSQRAESTRARLVGFVSNIGRLVAVPEYA